MSKILAIIQVWLGLVHFRHHHGQEATSGLYERGESTKEDVVWRAEEERSMSCDKKEVEGPDVKRPAGDWFKQRLVEQNGVSKQNGDRDVKKEWMK